MKGFSLHRIKVSAVPPLRIGNDDEVKIIRCLGVDEIAYPRSTLMDPFLVHVGT